MIIYEPVVADGYEWINTCDNNDYESFHQLDGQSRIATWKPVKVRRVRADPRHSFIASDFPWLGGHALIMRRTAVEKLRDILELNGEILPLLTDDEVKLWVFNSRICDALDEARSVITRFPQTNRIMFINKVAFIRSTLENIDVFRLPHRASSTYVSDRFVDRVNNAGLRGLEFNRVWSV